jgi:hypothetical protein
MRRVSRRRKRAVMADGEQPAAEGGELAFEPFDGRQVEMVGRLVEQQDVGVADQRAAERGAARLAAGELGQRPRRVERQAVQHGGDAVMVGIAAMAQAGGDMGADRLAGAALDLLRQVARPPCRAARSARRRRARPGRRAASAGSTCRCRCARPGKRCSPRPMPSVDAVEQRRGAESEARLAQREEGGRRRHVGPI